MKSEFGKVQGKRKGGEELIYACPRCLKIKLEYNTRKRVFNCWSCGFSGKIHETDDLLQRHGVSKLPHQNEWPTVKIPGRQDLVKLKGGYPFLRSRGIYRKRADELGICSSSEYRFHRRVIIPVVENRRQVCYIARAIDPFIEPKELAPPRDISNRGNFLFGLDDIEKDDAVTLVEGIFDREWIRENGYKCVAAMGSHLTEVQIGKLLAKHPRHINILFDADPAGYKGAKDTMRAIYQRYHGTVRACDIAGYGKKDPDELKPSEIKEMLR